MEEEGRVGDGEGGGGGGEGGGMGADEGWKGGIGTREPWGRVGHWELGERR